MVHFCDKKNGNLTYDGVYRYYYDCENRLTDVNNAADAALVSYKYDYRGRRVARKVGTATTVTYLYDGDQVISDYTGTGTTWRKRYYYGMGIDQPICLESYYPPDGGTAYLKFYYYDGLGSVVALANYIGQITEKYTYDVYGKPTTRNAQGVILPASDVNNRYLFTGREYDPCVGLYYYRARYYHPTIGRFMQTDPIGYTDGSNIYSYVKNSPLILRDPFGLMGNGTWSPGGNCWKKKVPGWQMAGFDSYIQCFAYALGINDPKSWLETMGIGIGGLKKLGSGLNVTVSGWGGVAVGGIIGVAADAVCSAQVGTDPGHYDNCGNCK